MLGCGLVILNFKLDPHAYPRGFTIGAVVAAGAVIAFMALHRSMPPVHHTERRRLVLKQRYGLYYLLSVLYGARKQVFITFGPVGAHPHLRAGGADHRLPLDHRDHAHRRSSSRCVGRLVDRVGPRWVLSVDAVLLLGVCLTYGFARDIVPERVAFFVVCGTYVLDLMLAPVQMARTVYLSRIAEHRRDLTGLAEHGREHRPRGQHPHRHARRPALDDGRLPLGLRRRRRGGPHHAGAPASSSACPTQQALTAEEPAA